MLAGLGFATIAVLLAAILTKKMTPLSALIAVPVAAALAGGFGLRTAGFMVKGIQVWRAWPACSSSPFCISA